MIETGNILSSKLKKQNGHAHGLIDQSLNNRINSGGIDCISDRENNPNSDVRRKQSLLSTDIKASKIMSFSTMDIIQKQKNKFLNEEEQNLSVEPPNIISDKFNNCNNSMKISITAVSSSKVHTEPSSTSSTTKIVNNNASSKVPSCRSTVDQTMKILIIGNAKCGKSSIIKRYVNQSFNDTYKTTVGADYQRKDLKVHITKDNNGDDNDTPTIHIENPIVQSTISHSTSTSNVPSLLNNNAFTSVSEIINNQTISAISSTTTSASILSEETATITAAAEECRNVRLQLWDIAGQDRFHKLTRVYFKNAVGVIIVCDVSRERTVEAIKGWKTEIDNWIDNISGESGKQKIPIVLFANKSDLLLTIDDAFAAGAAIEKVCHELGFLNWWSTSAMSGVGVNEGFAALVKNIIQLDYINNKSNSTNVAAKTSSSSSPAARGFKLKSVKPLHNKLNHNNKRNEGLDRYHDGALNNDEEEEDDWEFYNNNSFENNYSLCCA